MYAWIWRHLPAGPARLPAAAVAVIAVIAALLFVVFPALDALLPYTDVDVGP